MGATTPASTRFTLLENYKRAVENSDENLLKEVFAPQVLVEIPAGPSVNHPVNTASYILSQVAKTAPGMGVTDDGEMGF